MPPSHHAGATCGTRTLPSNAVVVDCVRQVWVLCSDLRAYACCRFADTWTHIRDALRTSPERASPHIPSRFSALESRSSPFLSLPRGARVRAYTSKNLLLPLLPRYLSHASGADFYKRSDSRGKFIKSLPLCHLRRYTVRFHED